MTSQKRWLLCVSVAGGARGRGGQLIPAGGISHQEAKKGVVVERTFYRLLEAGNHPLHAMYRVSSDLETVINFLIMIFEVNRFQDREPPNLLSVSKASQLLQIYFTLWVNCISIWTSLTKLSTSAVSLAWMKLHLKMGGPSLIPRPHTHTRGRKVFSSFQHALGTKANERDSIKSLSMLRNLITENRYYRICSLLSWETNLDMT